MLENDGISVLSDVMIEMRDGIRLAADIYIPNQKNDYINHSCWPVLLERTPYNKKGLNRSEKTMLNLEPETRPNIANMFARQGYVVVMQDCRGRYHSDGVFSKYINEAEDGFDTMTWIVKQAWCNGKIGTFGISYGAHTQIAAACLNPPGLACMFMDSGGFASAYHGGIRRGGAYELKQVTWAHRHALLSPETESDPKRKKALMEVDLPRWFQNMPWSPGNSPLSAAPEYEAYLFDQWQEGEYTDYWRKLGLSALEHYQNMPDIPVMILNSWYDPYVHTALTNFVNLKKHKKSPVFLSMGPWVHGQRSSSFSGDVDFGEEAIFENHFDKSYIDYRRDWFDWSLKNVDSSDFDSENPVSIFVMGGGLGDIGSNNRLNHGGKWQSLSTWPPSKIRYEPYYFSEGHRLCCTSPTKDKITYEEYCYDPSDPTPTIGGSVTSAEPLMAGGAFNQRESERFFGCSESDRDLKDRSDVISFESDPLSKQVVIAGPISATLWISSDCIDTDFVVKLIDVYPRSDSLPDGFAMNITDGLLRVRYRNTEEKTEFMDPGKIYKIEIQLFASANTFDVGHRIRVDIASANYPQFDFNSNTGEPEGSWLSMKCANNRVYLDESRPSHILLPVIDRGLFC
jgi:putative CocE/NonD family hydrolase